MQKKIRIIVFLTLIISLGIYFIWHEVAGIAAQSIYAGTIEMDKSEVPARVSSVVAKKLVREGDKVQQGQVVLELACEDIKLAATMAEKDFTRAQRLRQTGSIAEEAFEHIKNKYDESQLKLDWCSVKAPITGIVTRTYKNVGEMVTPGIPLLGILQTEEAWAYFYVPATELSRLEMGLEVTGFLPEIAQDFPGKLVHINDEAEFTPKNVQTRSERTRLVYGIKVTFNNQKGILKAGMPIEIKIWD